MKSTIEMAKEAGFPFNKYGLLQGDDNGEIDADKMFTAFEALVRADERDKTAAELRRLHKAHEDLLLILWWIGDRCPEFMLKKEPSRAHQEIVYDVGACARAAIKRATKDEQ